MTYYNIFVELNRLMQMIDTIFIDNNFKMNIDFLGKPDTGKNSINEDEFNLLYKYLLVCRFLASRIGDLIESEDNKSYQLSFEDILSKLIDIDKYYFAHDSLILKSKKGINKSILSLFKSMQKWFEASKDEYNISGKFKFYIPYSSDGEKIILDIFSKLINILENEERELHLIIMDEPDQRLHPNWSRQFLGTVIEAINIINETVYKHRGKKLNTQLIISTHSPFLLSDVRNEDVILLETDERICSNKRKLKVSDNKFKVFGANIHDILKNKFFFKERSIGEFAYKKMQNDFKIFEKSKEEFTEDYGKEKAKFGSDIQAQIINNLIKTKYLIDSIGEPVLKSSLHKEYVKRLSWIDEIENVDKEESVEDLLSEFSALKKEEKKIFLSKIIQMINKGDINDK